VAFYIPSTIRRQFVSTVLDETASDSVQLQQASTRMRSTMAAIRITYTWLGTTKTLSSDQKVVAADAFGAEGAAISASKKLLDPKHPALAAVTKIKGQVTKYWKDKSLPFPESGIRLIRYDQVAEFDQMLREARDELATAVEDLERHYSEMRDAARDRLGSLFNPSDYPATLIGAFGIEHSFPTVESPDYLRRLNPELYRQECQRVQAQFSEAVSMAEQMFFEQLSGLVDHLVERMSGTEDGRSKTFRDSTVENLNEFFSRFRQLDIGSSDQLQELVHRAQEIISGVDPQQLRDNNSLRQHTATQMSTVQASLDQLLVDRPRRNILRRNK
jgi:hypothetical protein